MRKFLTFTLMLVCSNLTASELKNENAKVLAKELEYSISATISKIIELETADGAAKDAVSFALQHDASADKALGLILQASGKILAVTPNSPADKIGFKSGDLIKSLSANAKKLDFSKPISLKAASHVEATVLRNSDLVNLNGRVETSDYNWTLKVNSQLPVQTADVIKQADLGECGRLSIFFRPPETKDYYNVMFNQLNDKNINRGREVIRVKPGKHKIKLNELIESRGLTIRRPNFIKGKILEVEVEANKTYHLAAEFDSNKRLISRGEQYWKPLVWKVTEKDCEL